MRKLSKVLLFCLLCLALYVSIPLAKHMQNPQTHEPKHKGHQPKHKKGELIVKFKHGVRSEHASMSHARHGSKLAKHFKRSRVHHVKLKKGLTAEEAAELYMQDPNVEYAEPNYEISALDLVPNDPRFSQIWSLHNTGQTGGTADADIDAPEAWDTSTGSSDVIVAVIDTGVDYTHEDLSANMWVNEAELNGQSGVDDDGNGYVDDIYGIDAYNNDSNPIDDNGHGTHCSGTIGAEGDNGIGVVGVNWNARIMALKFLSTGGSGYVDGAIACLEYVTMMKEQYGQNVRLTSNSWGGYFFSQALYDAIEMTGDADILFVAAAGNSAANNDGGGLKPASYDLPNIISVAATDHNDDLAYFSNWGRTSVDVAAPGLNIFSTLPPYAHLSGTCHDDDGDGYGNCSGTSMATPHVSGLAAFILAQYPELSWAEVKFNILSTVDPLPSLDGLVLTGGRINANNAVNCDPASLQLEVLSPSAQFGVAEGSQVVVSAFAGTCPSNENDTTVTVDFDNGDPSLTLYDDGVDPDEVANDGIHTVLWLPQSVGDVTLTFTADAGYDPVSEAVSGSVVYLTAEFMADTTAGDVPLTVQFTDLSEGNPGIETWQWDFDNNGTVDSTEQNPSHTYNGAGTFGVSLTVSQQGVDATETKVGYIA
jgi:subtilisin family serine protease